MVYADLIVIVRSSGEPWRERERTDNRHVTCNCRLKIRVAGLFSNTAATDTGLSLQHKDISFQPLGITELRRRCV
jgi:hypothetical protein